MKNNESASAAADAQRIEGIARMAEGIFESKDCGFHGHPATHSMNIRPLIPR